MQAHEQRVVDEAHELADKLDKLTKFTQASLFAELPREDQELLTNQKEVMMSYHTILAKRIARFT